MRPRAAFLLATVQAIEFVSQLLVPVALIRWLAPQEFGEYRLVWLAIQSTWAAIGFNVAGNLMYQLADASALARAAHVTHAVAWCALTGVVAAAALWVLSHHPFGGLALDVGDAAVAAAFALAWLASSPIEWCAGAVARPVEQAVLQGSGTAARVIAVLISAWWFRDLHAVLAALLLVACVRVVLLTAYAARRLRLPIPCWSAKVARSQAMSALTLGLGTGLFSLRQQVDQWVAGVAGGANGIALVALAASAAAATLFVRQGYNQVMAPHAVSLVRCDQLDVAVRMCAEANLRVASVLFPAVGLLAAVAPPLMAIAFTQSMRGAGAAAIVYSFGYAFYAIEVTSLLIAMGAQALLLRQGLVLLIVAIGGAFVGTAWMGPTGASLGGASTVVVGVVWSWFMAARRAKVPIARLQHWRAIAALAAVTIAAAVAGRAAGALLPWAADPRYELLVSALSATAVFAVLARLLRPARDAIVQTWRSLVLRPAIGPATVVS